MSKLSPNTIYSWEIELVDKTILKQFDKNGEEHSWKEAPLGEIVRMTFTPCIKVLPVHSVMINREKGEKFIKRFARGFLKTGGDGIRLREYINCVVTNRYRFYIFSNGMTLVTEPNYELYI